MYKCLEKGYKFPEITSWIRASKEDFKLVKEIGMKETGILVSCSDYHIFMKLKMTRKTGNGALPERHQGVPGRGISVPDAIWRISRGPIFTDMLFRFAWS